MEFYGLWGEIGGKIHSPNLPSQRDGKMEFWETGKEKRLDPNWNKFAWQNSLFIFPIPAQAPKFPLNSDIFFVGMRGKKLCQGVLIPKSPRKGKHRNVKNLSSSAWKSRWVPGWALEGPNP